MGEVYEVSEFQAKLNEFLAGGQKCFGAFSIIPPSRISPLVLEYVGSSNKPAVIFEVFGKFSVYLSIDELLDFFPDLKVHYSSALISFEEDPYICSSVNYSGCCSWKVVGFSNEEVSRKSFGSGIIEAFSFFDVISKYSLVFELRKKFCSCEPSMEVQGPLEFYEMFTVGFSAFYGWVRYSVSFRASSDCIRHKRDYVSFGFSVNPVAVEVDISAFLDALERLFWGFPEKSSQPPPSECCICSKRKLYTYFNSVGRLLNG